MIKFKKGDQIEGLGRDVGGDYGTTKKGWKGVVDRVISDSYISVYNPKADRAEMGPYDVEAKYFKLIKSNTMATKKKTKELELKDGQYFTANFNRKKVRGVVKEAYGDFLLLGKDFEDEADDEDNEFATQLYIDMYMADSVTKVLKRNGITNFVVLTDKRQKAVVDGDKVMKVKGHNVHIKGNSVEFGCGAVSTTKKEIREWYSVYKDLDLGNLETYRNIIDNFSEAELEAAVEIHNYLKSFPAATQKSFNNLVKEMDSADDVKLEDLDGSEVEELMKKLA